MAYVCGMHSGLGPGILYQLLILAAFMLIVVWLLRSQKPREPAKDILRRRLASGEITKKEYDRLLKDIE
jgi:uncharacterized membrane protein